jgi:hypothetical protein
MWILGHPGLLLITASTGVSNDSVRLSLQVSSYMPGFTTAGSIWGCKPAILWPNPLGKNHCMCPCDRRFMTDNPLLPTRFLPSPASNRSQMVSPIPSFPHPTTSSYPDRHGCLACNGLRTMPIAYIRPIENTRVHTPLGIPRRVDSLVLANWFQSPSQFPLRSCPNSRDSGVGRA